MSKTIWKSNYFCGHEVSEYGKANGYIDYGTLSRAFDAVMCNDITKLFYAVINGEYNEPEQVNGYIDNSEEIEALQEQIDELAANITEDSTTEQDEATEKAISELQEQIDELEREQDEAPEIYQYFIISDNGANILKDYTNEIVYYIPSLDIYIWGVTHCGTSWDYVLTDIKIELEDGEQ